MATFGTDGQISGDYVYLDAVTCLEYGCEPGWYETLPLDWYEAVPAGDTIIPFGEGVQIASSDCGAIITFTGEVSGERTFLINNSEEGGNTWTGNSSPVDLTLKDFAITPPAGGLQSTYSIQVATFGANGQISGDYVYLDDVTCLEYGCEPGWYETLPLDWYEAVPAGDVNIKSGEMFQVASSDCGGQITVPSAL